LKHCVKRSSSAGSEKMVRVGDRQGKMERYCSTGQSPQRAVVPMEEEEEDMTNLTHNSFFIYVYSKYLHVSSTHVLIIRRINCIN
jgi:hypothetical protein